MIDVADLKRENLPAGHFPADLRADFRLHIAPEVYDGISAHAKADASVEICGVLVGDWRRDELGPFAAVTNYIRCDSATSKFAEVTFTHESWAQINQAMDTQYADKRIIGWYHSHPDFGIFLSERDCFIQQHFFGSPGQVAYVVDPVRDLEGVFQWRAGKPVLMCHFWVGDDIHVASAADRKAPASHGREESRWELPNASAVPPARSDAAGPSLLTTLVSGLCVFLLGYLAAGWRSRWEQQMIAEGAVAHYGYNKVLKLGLDQDLAKVRQALAAISEGFEDLPEANDELSKDEAAAALKQRKAIGDALAASESKLTQIQQQYAVSADEQRILLMLLAEKHAQLRALTDAASGGDKPQRVDQAPGSLSGKPADAKPAPAAPSRDKENPETAAPRAAPKSEGAEAPRREANP
jgi:proteasome lid subunit RPN8/RPN11